MSEIQRFQKIISQILLETWDPLGVEEEENAQDEYDTYALQLVGMLARGATEDEIADFLDIILTTQFEMSPEIVSSEAAARAIVALRPK